ncbi:hypothetical protein CORC01_04796, partial [Colletotrichum orchidophilum]
LATASLIPPSSSFPLSRFFRALLQFCAEPTSSQTKPSAAMNISFGPPLYVPLFICKVLWGICWYTKTV